MIKDGFPFHVEFENGFPPRIILSVIFRNPDNIGIYFLNHRMVWIGRGL